MGVTEYPCPRCGQTQKVRAPNGLDVAVQHCAACKENLALSVESIRAIGGTKAEKKAQLEALAVEYRLADPQKWAEETARH